MRAVLKGAALSAALALASTTLAGAQTSFAECQRTPDGAAYVCRNGLIIYIQGAPGGVEDSGGPAWKPPEGWVRVAIVKADPNPWGTCLTYQWVPPGSEPQYPAGTFDPLINWPACTPAAGAAARGPAQVAALAWQRAPLPKPDPKIAPGRAITGKWAFLETRGSSVSPTGR